jgi:hypothetical protein
VSPNADLLWRRKQKEPGKNPGPAFSVAADCQ